MLLSPINNIYSNIYIGYMSYVYISKYLHIQRDSFQKNTRNWVSWLWRLVNSKSAELNVPPRKSWHLNSKAIRQEETMLIDLQTETSLLLGGRSAFFVLFGLLTDQTRHIHMGRAVPFTHSATLNVNLIQKTSSQEYPEYLAR